MKAVASVFRNRRLHDVTLDEIARHANVAKGTIYLYFEDKEDVIFQSAVTGFDEMCGLLRAIAEESVPFRERLLRACDRIVVFFRERRPLFRIVLSEGERAMESEGAGLRQRWRERRRVMTDAVATVLAEGMAAGEVRADIRPEILAEYLLSLLRTRSWDLEDWPESDRSHITVVDLFLNGVGLPARLPIAGLPETP